MAVKNKTIKGPVFIRFLKPVIEILKELGGSGNAGEVVDLVIDRMNISDEELSIVNKNGGSRIKNQVNWARMYLVNAGIIDNSTRGVWSLTDNGESFTLKNHDDAYRLFKSVQAKFKGEELPVEEPANEEADTVSDDSFFDDSTSLQLNHREQLIRILRALPPSGFEKICQRLLRESGFKKVTVTGKTGDGGIDGEGILEINPLITFKVLFQCKRYKENNTIGSSVIRDFRGAMQGRADKGIILTTSSFTKEAKKEAVRDGAPPIELVDAEGLVDLFENRELGLKPVTVYDLDHLFFREFLNG